MKYPDAIEHLIDQLMRFPGIGKKTAERYAFHVIHHFSSEDVLALIDGLHRVSQEIKPCEICGFHTDTKTCAICEDASRDKEQILVVEDSKDVIVLENAKSYNGLYHVLNGVISPANGIGPEDLSLKPLINRLKDDTHKELILAMGLHDEGEMTAMYIHRLLEKTDLLITRIAYGLPAGGNIGYADEVTLFKALEGRKKI